jgi:hypothetical protein
MNAAPRSFARRALRVFETCWMINGSWHRSRHWEWRLAWCVDALHVPAIIVAATGRFWMPPLAYWIFVLAAIAPSYATMSCPIVFASSWLRHRVDPTIQPAGLVNSIYRRWGRTCAVMIIVLGLALGIAVATVLLNVVSGRGWHSAGPW